MVNRSAAVAFEPPAATYRAPATSGDTSTQRITLEPVGLLRLLQLEPPFTEYSIMFPVVSITTVSASSVATATALLPTPLGKDVVVFMLVHVCPASVDLYRLSISSVSVPVVAAVIA